MRKNIIMFEILVEFMHFYVKIKFHEEKYIPG